MSYQFGHVDRDERIDLAADEPMGEPARWNMLPTPLLTVLVMAVFAGGLYFAYVAGTHHAPTAAVTAPGAMAPSATAPGAMAPGAMAPGAMAPSGTTAAAAPAGTNIPLIHADPQPMKVKPEQPGGIVVPDRDKLIYSERPGGPPVEKLLPPPEQPAPRPAPPPVAAVPPPAPPAQVAVVPARIPPPPAVKASPPRMASPPSAKPHPAAAAAIGADKDGHVRLQLASLRSPDEARTEWQRLKRLNPDLLGRMTADAVRDDLGDRGIWYRIEAGSFAQPAAAERVCRELKARHLGCSIVR